MSQPGKATNLAAMLKHQALVDMDVQTDESSTRPKFHMYVDSDMQTEEPSTSPKPRIFKDGDVQTESEESRKDFDVPSKRSRYDSAAADVSNKRAYQESGAAAASNDHESDVAFTYMADIAYDVQNTPNDGMITQQVKSVLISYFCILK